MSQDDHGRAKPGPLGLKPYLEGLMGRCDRLSKEELTAILVGLAKDMPTRQRAAFLERIDSIRDGSYFEPQHG